jgi:hypothetical protein
MEMTRKLNGRKELMDKMIPTNYAVGCRVSVYLEEMGSSTF